jgi:Cyclic nucleotide-binding domain
MGLLGKLSAWLDSRHQPEEEILRQNAADRDSLLRLTLSVGQRTVDFAISWARKSEEPAATGETSQPDDKTRTMGSSVPPENNDDRSHAEDMSWEEYISPEGDNIPSFWDALDPTEREALRSVASWGTFAAGARIMQEGDRADHVIVILGGRVKVCVHENGRERVLAIRGLGQLVGERGALEAGIRSATVIALDMVWALVVETKDFAAFVSAHQRVLGLVQTQLYERRTETPEAGDRDAGHPQARAAGRTFAEPPGGDHASGYLRQPLNGENCTVFLTDVVEFGSRIRTDGDRLLIRDALFRMTQEAMQEIPDARSEDRGDGFLTVVPPTVSTARVLEQLLKKLPSALGLHNSTQRESARFKLRLAVNVGPVVSDMGVSGEAIIVAARLVEAPHFKQAVTNSTACLGLIASPFVYETVIRHGANPRDVASYSQVRVNIKESDTTAWMRLLEAPPPSSFVRQPAKPEPFISQ